jgi:hypothetical protein
VEIGLLTPKEIITTREVATQTENDAEVEAKIYLCIACITREIQIIGQGIVPSSWSPRRKNPKAESITESPFSQRNQPHIPLAQNIAIIILKSTFVPTLQLSFRIPSQLP